VPFDPEKPFVTSGIRIGTPAVTTRGMGTDEMKQIGKMISRVIKNRKDEDLIAEVRKEVSALCERFPLYSELQ
jgi:glycine hydroxymethyltransferase